MARRALLVCYQFPPVASVGSVRVGALAKHLPRHGWDVTVVTSAHPERSLVGADVVETADSDRARELKRVLGLRGDLALKDQVGAEAGAKGLSSRARALVIEVAKAIVLFPDAYRGWAALAVDAAAKSAANRSFDAILTSSPPVSAHLAGAELSRRLALPWVADLRDLWTDDHNSRSPGWRRRLERRLERRTLGRAAALVTVSTPLVETLSPWYPKSPVHAILNGYDPTQVGPAPRLDERFTICHTGTFYQGRRDPAPLFDALRSLLESKRIDRGRIRVRLLSRDEPWLRREIETRALADVVQVEPWVAWPEALRAQREAQILLLLHWGGAEERGVYTGKIFEYLAARRPVLMVGGGDGVLADLLAETRAGVHVRDRAALEAEILRSWEEFRATGRVAYHGDTTRIERYSHDRMAREFAQVLDRAVG
jgi:hypothetical protein